MNQVTSPKSPESVAKASLPLPFVITVASDFGTPVSLFYKLSEHEGNAFLFESTEGDHRLARFSLLGIDPVKTISIKSGQATVKYMDGTSSVQAAGNPVLLLQSELDKFKEELKGRVQEEAFGDESVKRLELPFLGGLVGYLGYGAIACMEPVSLQRDDPLAVPDGHYGLYDSVIVFDQQYRRVSFVSFRSAGHARALLEKALKPPLLALPPMELPVRALSDQAIFEGVAGPFDQSSFMAAVLKAKEFICEGQAFQIVVAQRLSALSSASAIDIYRALQATNPSPYAYIVKCPDFVYLGSSPETFVRCQKGEVLLRAIAGTRPRGADEKEDLRLAKELRESEKEMAEHRMLVDLGRNDLGRVCKPGSIAVGQLAQLTRYTHVMHLATEITGRLDNGKSCFDAFRSCFPAGTVSGAPKVRAMQLLFHLEPEQRGIYSGAVGYFDLLGNMDGAIAIRSALVKDGQVHVTAGAGIVYDSDPLMEYEETRSKAKSVLQAIKMAEAKRS